MPIDRRDFLQWAAGGLLAGTLASRLGAQAQAPIRAVAFDALAIFDARPVFALVERLFPGQGAELSAAWRTRQFEYQWLRVLAGHYADFEKTTEDALVFAARQRKIDLAAGQRAQLLNAWLALEAWPDVAPTLDALAKSGLRLAFLSNMTPRLLESGLRNSKLEGRFEHVLSTDARKVHKPDTRAYQMGVDAFGLLPGEIAFVAFAGWDAAGARWFGYPTYWANRTDAPHEELGVAPDAIASDLGGLARFVANSHR